VRKIRVDKVTMSYSELSKKYGLSTTCLYKIVHRRTWNHVK
jgi:Mor family transcriptional regulator